MCSTAKRKGFEANARFEESCKGDPEQFAMRHLPPASITTSVIVVALRSNNNLDQYTLLIVVIG